MLKIFILDKLGEDKMAYLEIREVRTNYRL